MKRTKKYLLIGLSMLTLGSCNSWLDITPENEQVSDIYWNTKEDVKAVVAAGYYYLRATVPSLIQWSELRGGAIYSQTSNNLQSFQVLPTDKALCNWGDLYKVINVANAVLKNIDDVQTKDNTFNLALVNSYKSEAYFLRALTYFYLVRNWREVPLILTPYENDETAYSIAKSSEEEVLIQIKADLQAALNTGAAREAYETAWESKGRATIWAIYALQADVYLWSGDYAQCVNACNSILNSQASKRPVFMVGNSEDTKWFTMFYPGNSNESIFEIQYSYENNEQTNDLSYKLFGNNNPTYYYSKQMVNDFIEETTESAGLSNVHRGLYGGYICSTPDLYETQTVGYVWKYTGKGYTNTTARDKDKENDPNYIVYRVADVKLMKAEALIMQGSEHFAEAAAEINDIRKRANLTTIDDNIINAYSTQEMLEVVLKERNIEFAAEGKRWYDLLRYGRCNSSQYREQFINIIVEYNQTANPSWIRSVLRDDNALFLPIWETELNNNPLLVQNPYYK